MVESDQLVGQNEEEIKMVGDREYQAAAIRIVPSNKQQQQHAEGGAEELNSPQNPTDDHRDEKILNGACGGVGNTRHSWSLPQDEALPLKSDVERGSNKLGGEDSLPSPVILGPSPPDGGLRAYMVMLASFFCNGIIFGTINSGGIIFVELKKILEEKGIESPASYACKYYFFLRFLGIFFLN